MSLTNPSFSVVFTDPTAIQTTSGNSLQALQSNIQMPTIQVFSQDQLTSYTQYGVVGLVLSAAMIIPVFLLCLCSPVAVFHSLEAFQLISLFAYVKEVPPNLYYLLQNLRISRFTFLPNIFENVYQ
jgi:hypothetical protein